LRFFGDSTIEVEQYLSGNFASNSEFIQSSENLAMERPGLFAQFIKTNPQTAIEKSVSEEVQKQLPRSGAQFLEKSVSTTGDFNVYAIDTLDSSDEQTSDHNL
jgi:hypothetical protein